MAISSLEYVVCLLIASAVMPLIKGVRGRQGVYASCSFAFLLSYLPNVESWVALAAFLLSGYLCAISLLRKSRPAMFVAYLVSLLIAFLVLKQYGFLERLLPTKVFRHPIAIVGLSYILFRQIHFLVDSMQGQLKCPRLWDYLNYQLDFAALVAGPIQAYQDFCDTWHSLALPANHQEILRSYLRLFVGIIKVAGLAAPVLFVYERVYERMLGASLADAAPTVLYAVVLFAAIFYSYPIYVYLNFSGYCDIAISSAALLGVQLPENFDRPYLSRNMLDFWTRWHRTLGLWIRDYLFTPIYKGLVERTSLPANIAAGAAYFLAFLFAGIWHGTTSNFALFGALHGAGAWCTKGWEAFLVNRFGRPFVKGYVQSRPVRIAAIALTLNYFCFTMLFFSGPLSRSIVPFRVLIASIQSATVDSQGLAGAGLRTDPDTRQFSYVGARQ